MMKRLILAAAVAGFGLAMHSPAEAMTLAPVAQADNPVTLVSGGCGPGGFRDRFGNCRPIARSPAYGRPCPPRLFLDRFGHCRFR